jgi:hypothetical protein
LDVKKTLLLPILFLIYWGCEEPKEEVVVVDTTPPTVTITSPQDGSTVSDSITITCMSSDNEGVEKVELWVNGVSTGVTDNTEPYSLNWNTTTHEDGSFTIIVRSYDLSGNTTDSDPMTLTVDNSSLYDCAGVLYGDNICGCTDSIAANYDSNATFDDGSCSYSYLEWTVIGSGLDADVQKNALTEFVGSTNCPSCPAADSLLLSYLNPSHVNYVGTSIADRWSLINYHTYSPSRGDPMYEFLRGAEAEDDFCYVRFEEGSWYNISGVPTTFTNGFASAVYPEMAVSSLDESTPVQMGLNGTTINGMDIQVEITINSSSDLTTENSLYLFIAATIDSVDYTGYNGEPHHQDVFLGWITDGFNGELLSITHEEKMKTYTWQMPSNWPQNDYETSWSQVEWDPANLHIVAFIQDLTSKEILQVISY